MRTKLLTLATTLLLTAAPALAVDWYVIGENVNGHKWILKESDCKFTEESNGIYSWKGNTLSSGFKLNDGTWTNDNQNLGSNDKISLNQTFSLSQGGSSGNIYFQDGISEITNPILILNTNNSSYKLFLSNADAIKELSSNTQTIYVLKDGDTPPTVGINSYFNGCCYNGTLDGTNTSTETIYGNECWVYTLHAYKYATENKLVIGNKEISISNFGQQNNNVYTSTGNIAFKKDYLSNNPITFYILKNSGTPEISVTSQLNGYTLNYSDQTTDAETVTIYSKNCLKYTINPYSGTTVSNLKLTIGDNEVSTFIENGIYSASGALEYIYNDIPNDPENNIVYFNPAGTKVTGTPSVYAWGDGIPANSNWGSTPAMTSPIKILVKGEDGNYTVTDNIYYYSLDKKYTKIIFKDTQNNQTEDLNLIPNGYYTKDTPANTDPTYLVINSKTVLPDGLSSESITFYIIQDSNAPEITVTSENDGVVTNYAEQIENPQTINIYTNDCWEYTVNPKNGTELSELKLNIGEDVVVSPIQDKGIYSISGSLEGIYNDITVNDDENIIYFNNAGSDINTPYYYAWTYTAETGDAESNTGWNNTPKMGGPVNVLVATGTDANNNPVYEVTPVYYAVLKNTFTYVIFKASNENGTKQTSDFYIVPNGYYKFDTPAKTAPEYAIEYSKTVYNHVPSLPPYTIYVTYDDLQEGQDVNIIFIHGDGGAKYVNGSDNPDTATSQWEKMNYCEIDGTKYYKWSSPIINTVEKCLLKFSYPDGTVYFNNGKKDDNSDKGYILKNYMIFNLTNKDISYVPDYTLTSVIIKGNIETPEGLKGTSEEGIEMEYDPTDDKYYANVRAIDNIGKFYLLLDGVRYGVNDPTTNGFKNGVWQNVVAGDDAYAQFDNSSRYYQMVYNPRSEILMTHWIENNSNIKIQLNGEDVSSFSVDAKREYSENEAPAISLYIRGSQAFNQVLDDDMQQFYISNMSGSLIPDKDSFVNMPKKPKNITPNFTFNKIDDDNNQLIVTINNVPVPGKYNLQVKYTGNNGDFKTSTATIPVYVCPTIESIGLTFLALDWENPPVPVYNEEQGIYTVSYSLQQNPVDKDGNPVLDKNGNPDSTKLYFGSEYGYVNEDRANKFFSVYYDITPRNSQLAKIRKQSAAPDFSAMTEYTKPIPYDTAKNIGTIKLAFKMNGAESQNVQTVGVTSIDDIVTSVSGLEAEVGDVVIYNLNGLRVNAENLTPGIYIVVRDGKTSKVLVK